MTDAPSKSVWFLASESSGKKRTQMAEWNINSLQHPANSQKRSSLDGPLAILWDIENCPVPSDVRPEDVAGNIRMALQVHPVIKGAVKMFSAYGDFNAFPRRLREGCQRTGIKLVDVPNGRKDAADKAILVDMFLFALDNPPPSYIMLISGDVDFAPALHILGQRGYTVVLVIPAGVGVSSALSNAGKFVWDWPSVARGEGFVPPPKLLVSPRSGLSDIAGYLMGCHINDKRDGQNEEALLNRGVSQSYYNSGDFSVVSQSLSGYNCSTSSIACLRSHSLPSGPNDAPGLPFSTVNQNECLLWVQPGDLNGLKGQLVKLLELSAGCLPLTRIPTEYQKIYGRPLYVSEYGAFKLVHLFKKMSDVIAIEGKGNRRFVYLRNWRAGPSAPPLVLNRNNRKGKWSQEESVDCAAGGCSSDELSDEERVVAELADRNPSSKPHQVEVGRREIEERSLEQFKYELQEILVSYSCGIFLGCFEAVYQQRYKKPLDYQIFGVDSLEDLLEKVRDVVVLHEEPVTKKKFMSAAIGG